MFKKIRVFLFSSLASLMAMSSALSTENNGSFGGLRHLSEIDNNDSILVRTSRNINKKIYDVLRKILGLTSSGIAVFNVIPLVTRFCYGKAKYDDCFFRMRGGNSDLVNYISDGIQILVPLYISYKCFHDNDKQKVYPEHYLKKLLLSLDNSNDKNDRNITVINNYNYYNVSPEKKV